MGTWWGKVYVLAVGDDPRVEAVFRLPACSAACRAMLCARFPGDTRDCVLLANAAPSVDCAAPHFCASPARLKTLTDKSFVSAPG
jgi:hypothetical protein